MCDAAIVRIANDSRAPTGAVSTKLRHLEPQALAHLAEREGVPVPVDDYARARRARKCSTIAVP